MSKDKMKNIISNLFVGSMVNSMACKQKIEEELIVFFGFLSVKLAPDYLGI
jgi:hypothetical protein